MEDKILELIKTRRSVRSYEDKKVPEELLDKILEAGTYAPSGRGMQSPVIVAITSEKYRNYIKTLNAGVLGVDIDPYYGAPVVIVVLADPNINTWVEDGSLVLGNMMLEAHALGLGSVWIHREREIFDTNIGKTLLKEWNLPENLRGVGAIALGYIKGNYPEAKARKENYIKRV